MSQNMQGEAGIVLVKAPFQAPWGCGERTKSAPYVWGYCVIQHVRLCKERLERRKISALFKKKNVSLGTRFPGETVGPDERLALTDRTLEGALRYLKDGVMTVGCRLCVKWKHKWNSSGHVRFSLVVTLDRNASLTWRAYTSDMCVNTLLISSFQSLFPCFHFWHNFKYKF